MQDPTPLKQAGASFRVDDGQAVLAERDINLTTALQRWADAELTLRLAAHNEEVPLFDMMELSGRVTDAASELLVALGKETGLEGLE